MGEKNFWPGKWLPFWHRRLYKLTLALRDVVFHDGRQLVVNGY
jgi:hypothetical protein